MSRSFTYILNQLRMDTMAQCTSPTLNTSMTNPVSHVHRQSFLCSDRRTANVLEGLAELGLPIIGDVNNGTAAGAMTLPSSMHPDNQTRFDAREAHFNSASSRYNLHIATNQTVTQLVLDSNSAYNSNRRVMGVEVQLGDTEDKEVTNLYCSLLQITSRKRDQFLVLERLLFRLVPFSLLLYFRYWELGHQMF
jgi:hypothetical protein